MKKLFGAITFWLLICSASFAESLGEQLIKLEGLYERGTITKQEFDKAKSILLKMDQDSAEKIAKFKDELSEEQKKKKEKLITDLKAEVNQTKSYNYSVGKYASNAKGEWEKTEFLFDDYRVYAHRPGAIKIRRISDGKTLAVISDKFKIKFKNGGENLFVIEKFEKNTLEKKGKSIELLNQLDLLKTSIEKNIFEAILPQKKLPGRVTFKYNGETILNWERAFVPKHNAHFFQILALDDQPFHFYIVKGNKKFALNMAKFVKKIDIAVAEVKIKLAKKYNLSEEEIDLIIKQRKQNYDKQLASISDEAGKAIARETEKAVGQEASKAVNIEVAKKIDSELAEELDRAIGAETAKEFKAAVEATIGYEMNEALEKEFAQVIDQSIADAVAEGISAATAEAAIRASLEALGQGATIEQAMAVCKAAGGGSAC